MTLNTTLRSGLFLVVAVALAGAMGCKNPDAMLVKVTADDEVDQVALFIRDEATKEIVFNADGNGWVPVVTEEETAKGKTRDLRKEALKIALNFDMKGTYTFLLVGVKGQLETTSMGKRPVVGATVFFWADRFTIKGTKEIKARLLTVPSASDLDRDYWPNPTTWLAGNAEAATEYASKMDLLDCYDAAATDPKTTTAGKSIDAANINPFAKELCGDGVDEACNGDTDETCKDSDSDGDPEGSDCDDSDPARHHPTTTDPFPDPPNCCGYNLGFAKGTPEAAKNYGPGSPDANPMLCPAVRCGNGIDNACKGGATNLAANDTPCVVDDDCDTYPASNDCDDHDPAAYPGAPEPCGGTKDLNCSGKPNDGCVPCDLDGDTYQRNDAANGCPNTDNAHPGVTDCNDHDASVFPTSTSTTLPGRIGNLGGKEGGTSAAERIESARRSYCRRIYEPTGLAGTSRSAFGTQVVGDFDCDGVAYNNCPSTICDLDGDGFPNENSGCTIVGIPSDCDDNDPNSFPGAPDYCGDGKPQDCLMDRPCTGDTDNDHYVGADDCAEGDATRHPWATELCDGIDNDCDGIIDENNPDATGKPLLADGGGALKCTDSNVGECAKTEGDCVCSPSVPNSVFDPGGSRNACPTNKTATTAVKDQCFGAGQPAAQSCDASNPKDDDCDGRVDAPDGKNLKQLNQVCGIAVGECRTGTIVGCDMTKPNCFSALIPATDAWLQCSTDTTICPSAEVCDGKDNDCNGALPTDEQDLDGDKYLACSGCNVGMMAAGLTGCGDCLDTGSATGSKGSIAASAINPVASDTCDGVDNNCNGNGDEGATCTGGHDSCCPNPGGYDCRDLAADTNNCTTCGNVCNAQYANLCSVSGCVCGATGAACTGSDKCEMVTGDNSFKCRKPLGASCGVDVDCDSGHCADGVCCNTACTGQCEQCDGTVKGTCAQVTGFPVTGHTPSRSLCNNSPQPAAGDACDGTCNGTGGRNACNYPTASCRSAACDGANDHTAIIAASCSNGDCPALSTMDCGKYKCVGTACKTTCASDSDCSGTTYCKKGGATGTCVDRKMIGDTCSTASDCQSGSCTMCGTAGGCIDGHCCNDATCGTTPCRSCSTGTCSAVTSADDPECTPTLTKTCSSTGQCLLKPSNTCTMDNECASGQCECKATGCGTGKNCCSTDCTPACTPVGSGVASVLSGQNCAGGTCAASTNCGLYTGCSGTTCATSCASDGDCITGYHCNGSNLCVANCSTDGDCASGQYCDKQSGGTCKTEQAALSACNGGAGGNCKVQGCRICAGDNTCSNPTGSGNCPCRNDADCGAGTYCDDAGGGTCVTEKAKGAACNGNDCKSGTACRMCNGDNQCSAASSGRCPCAVSGDCNGTEYCNGTTCTADVGDGNTCTADDQCTNGPCGTTAAPKKCCASACNGACQNTQCAAGTGACGTAASSTVCNTNYICGGSQTCPSSCTNGAQCAPGNWCHGSGTRTCGNSDLIPSGGDCSDADCKTTGCLQCQGMSGGVACTAAGGTKCP